jgi:hypothetical protein
VEWEEDNPAVSKEQKSPSNKQNNKVFGGASQTEKSKEKPKEKSKKKQEENSDDFL